MSNQISTITPIQEISDDTLATYTLGDELYRLRACIDSDIPYCLWKMVKYWRPDEIAHQRERMEKAVNEGTAWIITNNGKDKAFVYVEKEKKIGYLIAMWFERKRYLAMLYHFSFFHLPFERFRFLPHDPNIEKIPFLFAVTQQSIMRFRAYGEYLEIIVGSDKLQKLANLHYNRIKTMEHYIGRRRRNIRSDRSCPRECMGLDI